MDVPPNTCSAFSIQLYALGDWPLRISPMGSSVLQLRLKNKKHWQKHQEKEGDKANHRSLLGSSLAGYVPWQLSLSGLFYKFLCPSLKPQYVSGVLFLALGYSAATCVFLPLSVFIKLSCSYALWGSWWKPDWYFIQGYRNPEK